MAKLSTSRERVGGGGATGTTDLRGGALAALQVAAHPQGAPHSPGEAALTHALTFENAWVRAVDAGQRRIPGWAGLLIAVAVVIAAMFGGVAVYRALPLPQAYGVGGYLGLVADRLAGDACIVGPLALLAVIMVRWVERRPCPEAALAPIPAALAGGGLGTGLFLLALAVAWGLGGVGPGQDHSPVGHRLAGVVVGGVLILLQAGAEEGFFRGWLQPLLAARWGPWVALIATALLFAAAHAVISQLSLVAFLNDTLAGAGFGLLALRSGGLAAPIAAHWGWNWTEQALAGATPNPGVDPLGSLFDVDLRGPGLISGGADEMNGSLCATVALLLLIAAAALIRPRAASAGAA